MCVLGTHLRMGSARWGERGGERYMEGEISINYYKARGIVPQNRKCDR